MRLISAAPGLDQTLSRVRACTHCAAHLPLGPRPVLRAQQSARLLIIGQAPGTRVHQSGTPWDDRSGERLRQWMQISTADFYDDRKIAIVPMGFCYPGVNTKGGDNPPRPECAPLWHEEILAGLPHITLTLLIGQYAQKHYLGRRRGKTLTATVAGFATHLPDGILPLPHPSWRTTAWQKKHLWFDRELLPELRARVSELVG